MGEHPAQVKEGFRVNMVSWYVFVGPKSGLSSGAKAAIGVVVVLVIISGLLLVAWWLRKKHKSSEQIIQHETFDNPIHFSSQAYDMDA